MQQGETPKLRRRRAIIGLSLVGMGAMGMVSLLQTGMFVHQLPHMWIDFRGIQDDYMTDKAIDYFENSRRAIYAQQNYAMRNPKKLVGYDRYRWGITVCDGPGPAVRRIKGRTRRFYDHVARSIPYGPDDGTLAPWAVVASLPFAPEVVLPSLKQINEHHSEMTSKYGFKCSYNPTFTASNRTQKGWVSKGYSVSTRVRSS